MLARADLPWTRPTRRGALLLALALLAPAAPACERAVPVEASAPWPDGLVKPTSVDEARRSKAAGVVWTDRQVRQLYLERAAAIGPADAAARARGDAPEARARAAFGARHDARKIARAMMQDAAAVAALEARDREKYGDPDGPTFAWLVERNTQKGLSGAAVYEAIVESAQQTDAATNAALGL